MHLEHFKKDKKLYGIASTQPEHKLVKRKNLHFHLCNSIMSQQLSTKVADVFQLRFLNLFDGKVPTSQQILDMPFDTLRSIGLSNAKASYVHNIARFFIQQKLVDKDFSKMTDEDVVGCLTEIKGVGRWTVEMILMFVLGREDIFAIDDLGIQQAMCKLYKIDAENKKAMKEKMLKLSKKWSPYRTYACRYLWGWKDNEPEL